MSLSISFIDSFLLETLNTFPFYTPRYRPSNCTGERKHNILSNISICGETDIENFEETRQRLKEEKKKSNQKNEKLLSVKQEDESEPDKLEDDFVPASMPNQSVVTEPINPVLGEDELTGLLLATNGWDDCQLELLDSLLDSL